MKKHIIGVWVVFSILALSACTKKSPPSPVTSKNTPQGQPPQAVPPAQSNVQSPQSDSPVQSADSSGTPLKQNAINPSPNSITPQAITQAIREENAEKERIAVQREEQRNHRVDAELKAAASTAEGARYSALAEKRAAKIKAVRALRAAEAKKKANSAVTPGANR